MGLAGRWKQIRPCGNWDTSTSPPGYHLVARPTNIPLGSGQGLANQLIGRTIEYYDELPSTNQRAEELLAVVDEGAVVLRDTDRRPGTFGAQLVFAAGAG